MCLLVPSRPEFMLAGSGLLNMDQPWEQQDFHLRELLVQ